MRVCFWSLFLGCGLRFLDFLLDLLGLLSALSLHITIILLLYILFLVDTLEFLLLLLLMHVWIQELVLGVHGCLVSQAFVVALWR